MTRVVDGYHLADLFKVSRRTIVRWSKDPDFPAVLRYGENRRKLWDLDAVLEWGTANDAWDDVVGLPTGRKSGKYDRNDPHTARMKHGPTCAACLAKHQRHLQLQREWWRRKYRSRKQREAGELRLQDRAE